MKFTAAQIAGILEGEIEGNPEVEVSKLAKIEEGSPGSLTFLSNPKYTSYIYKTQASITIVNKDFKAEDNIETTLIRVEDAYKAFSKLLEYYNQVEMNKTGIEQPVFIAESANYGENLYMGAFSYLGDNVSIGNNVKIYPNVYIGDNVQIGDDCVVFAGSKIYSETVIGNHCVIHSGAIVGADGFGFAHSAKGWVNIEQIGRVIIGDDVEVGASSTIDRAALNATIIGNGVKLDNQVHIGHDTVIGKHCLIASQTGVAGCVIIEDRVKRLIFMCVSLLIPPLLQMNIEGVLKHQVTNEIHICIILRLPIRIALKVGNLLSIHLYKVHTLTEVKIFI